MKQFYLASIILFFGLFFSACDKDDDNLEEAYVISYRAEKCMCCPGFLIQIGNDTIKTESGVVYDIIGANINFPIPIYVELGVQDEVCSNYYRNTNTFEVERIKLRKED